MATKKLQIVGSIVPQSDFNQTDSTQPDYIKNKPEIDTEVAEGSENIITSGGVYSALQNVSGKVESVNGKTGVINLTASDVGALPNTTQIPTVPTNVSAFVNDKGYLTEHQSLDDYVTDSTFITELNKKQNILIFDTKPTENSTNLVNSGDLYNMIGDIDSVLAQINTLIGGAS